MNLHFRPYTLTPIATNDGRFFDFAPYVASINDDGVVAFQATLEDGHTGIFTSDGSSISDVAITSASGCPVQQFSSHPDLNRSGQLSVYATLKSGDQAAILIQPDGRIIATDERHGFNGIGPLGPTMNERGDIALRVSSPSGHACIGVLRDDQFHPIAKAGSQFLGFEGLPVVNQQGHVLFRANLPDAHGPDADAQARQGVFLYRAGECTAIATTADGFEEMAPFPIINDHGTVAFVARRRSGVWGLFIATSSGLECLIDVHAGFVSFRGILINNAGPVAFYGTPVGGQMGIYSGPDPLQHRVLGLGDALFGATVVDFALNPVSVNERGQLAIRVALDDQRQYLLRADPAG